MSAQAPAVANAATPSTLYANGVARGDWNEDPAQRPALRELDRIHAALLDPPKRGLLGGLFGKKSEPSRGLYLWGGVGRGKTFLIDLFYDALPFEQKRRTHFHRFMWCSQWLSNSMSRRMIISS